MKRVLIDESLCIGCGECEKDCVSRVIGMEGGKAKVLSDQCIKCSHCVAICPVKAVSISGYDGSEVVELAEQSSIVTPDGLMATIKSLRTIRHFKEGSIDEATIREIVEAGRYTATAGNQQHVRYIVVQNGVEQIEQPVLKRIKLLQKVMNIISKFVKLPYNLSDIPFEKGFLFKNAPVIILTVSESVLDASLAARSMELMMSAKGLGGLYVGFFTAIANKHKKVRRYLGLNKKEKIVTCLAIGIPDVKYYRTAPRNKADIVWK